MKHVEIRYHFGVCKVRGIHRTQLTAQYPRMRALDGEPWSICGEFSSARITSVRKC